MAEILGKVTGLLEVPRGADVSLRIGVPHQWFIEGPVIEIELPRHLTCAKCQGGGCGKCGNSGAITLRGRGELSEVIQVSLPQQSRVDSSSDALRTLRPVTIRIPGCGGLPEPGSDVTVRGWLLLEVTVAEAASSNVRLLEDEEPLSSSKTIQAEMRRDPLADSLNGESKTVKVGRLSSRSPARRSGLPEAMQTDSPTVTVEGPSKPGLLLMLSSSHPVRWSVGLLVVALMTLWMWYWR